MTHEDSSEDELWVIADMLPIAVAHAEAAAKAAGLSVGEWLARLIAADAPPTAADSETPPPAQGTDAS